MTPFTNVYNVFLSKVTDDMYMELTKGETEEMLDELLFNALNFFEFPRVNIFDYDVLDAVFNVDLSKEEINIIATYMVVSWLDQQLASVENVRMKYSGQDFKFTSQANHLSKLIALKIAYKEEGFHLQRLYKRRKSDSDGIMRSTMSEIMQTDTKVRSWLSSMS